MRAKHRGFHGRCRRPAAHLHPSDVSVIATSALWLWWIWCQPTSVGRSSGGAADEAKTPQGVWDQRGSGARGRILRLGSGLRRRFAHPLAGGARPPPAPAAAPRSPHHHPPRPRRAIAPSAIGSSSPNVRNGIGGSRREPLGRRGAPAAGAGRSSHADARRAPSRPRRGQRVWNANFRSNFNSASRDRGSPSPSRARRPQRT